MLSYCLKCRNNTESKNSKIARAKKVRIMLLSKYAVRDSEISKFSKQQEANRLLRSLGITNPSSKTPLIGLFLF